MVSVCGFAVVILLKLQNSLLFPPGNVIQEWLHPALPGIFRPKGRAKEIKVGRMGDFGVAAEGFELEVTVVESLPTLFWVF